MKVQFTPPALLREPLFNLQAGATFMYELYSDSHVFLILNPNGMLNGLNAFIPEKKGHHFVCYTNIKNGEIYCRFIEENTTEVVYVVEPLKITEFRTIETFDTVTSGSVTQSSAGIKKFDEASQ